MNLIKEYLGKDYFLLTILLFFPIIELFLSMTNPKMAGLLGSVIVSLSIFYKKSLPLCIDMMLKVMNIGGGLIQVSQPIIILSALLMIYENWKKIDKTVSFLIVFMSIVLLISYNTGFNADSKTATYMIVDILKLAGLSCIVLRGDSIILTGCLLFTGVSMSVLIGYALLTGNFSVFNEGESLSFLDNAKALSTAIAPLCYFAVFFIFSKIENKPKTYIIIASLVALFVLSLIILTYSRGVMLALIGAVGYLIISRSKKNRGKSILMLTCIFLGIYFLTSIMSISNDRIFDNVEGGNGRTDIWMSFYGQMKSHDCMLFGFGPGSTKEISLTGYYSHSAILDYLFCYGYAGFLYIILFIYIVGKDLFKSENSFYMSLFILNIMMFFPHGSSLSHMFIFINGICLGQAMLTRIQAPHKTSMI